MTTATLKGCSHPGCDVRRIRRVDLFCHTHQQFLPLAGLPGWVRATALLLFATLLGVLVLLSARNGSAVPVFLAAGAVGLALAVLPLRHLGPAPIVVGLTWIGLCLAALVSFDGAGARFDDTFTLLLIVATAVGFVVRSMMDVFDDRPGARRSDVAAGMLPAAFLALSLGALLVWSIAADPPFGAFAPLPGGLSTALLYVSAFAAGAAALVVAGLATLAGILLVFDDDEWLIPAPARFRSVRRPAAPATAEVSGRRDPLTQINRAVSRFVAVTSYVVLTVLAVAGNVLLRFLHAVLVLLVGIVNWLLQFVIACATYLKATSLILFRAVWTALRFTVVPVAALTAAALLAVHFATTALRYLTDGQLVGIPAMLGYALAAVVALNVAWTAACGLPPGGATKSAVDSIVPFSAWFLIFTVVAGWALWLLGPLHLGPVTLGSTALLALIVVFGAMRRRAEIRALRTADGRQG